MSRILAICAGLAALLYLLSSGKAPLGPKPPSADVIDDEQTLNLLGTIIRDAGFVCPTAHRGLKGPMDHLGPVVHTWCGELEYRVILRELDKGGPVVFRG